MVTDGRFSGTNNGCLGARLPEAAEGAPSPWCGTATAILIDIPAGAAPGGERGGVERRRAGWQAPPAKFTSGYLAIYAAASRRKGASSATRLSGTAGPSSG